MQTQSTNGAQPDARPLRIGIYCRVSSKLQEDNTSLASQETACRAWTEARGGSVVAVERDIGSGEEIWETERPGLARLRALVRDGGADLIVANSTDRISRNPVHLGMIHAEADEHNARIDYVTEPTDDSIEGELIRFVRGWAGKIQNVRTREASMRGKRTRAQSGLPMAASKPPYGYRWQLGPLTAKGTPAKLGYEIHEPEAAIVRFLFAEAAAGRSLWQLADDLTARRVPTPKGGAAWQTSTIYGLLHNPIYTGTRVAFRQHVEKDRKAGTRRTVYRKKDDAAVIVTEAAAPALVTPETFAAVADRFRRGRTSSYRNHRAPEETKLRNHVFCGHCGNKMYGLKRARGGYLYRCPREQYDTAKGLSPSCRHHTIAAAPLDTAVIDWLERWHDDPAAIERAWIEMRDNDPTAGDAAAVAARRVAVERSRDNYLAAIGVSEHPAAIASLSEKLATAESDLAEIAATEAAVAARQALYARGWQQFTEGHQAGHNAFAAASVRTPAGLAAALERLGVRVLVFRPGSDERWRLEAVRLPEAIIGSTSTSGSDSNVRLIRLSDREIAA